MKYLRSLRGKFEKKHFDLLIKKGINSSSIRKKRTKYPGLASFTMLEDELYFEIISSLRNADSFSDRRMMVVFDEEELKSYKYFFLKSIVPVAVTAYERVVCGSCRRDDSGSSYHNHFEKLPILSDKNLFGRSGSFNPYYITDLKRYALLKDRFSLKSKPIYFGKNKVESKDYVGLDIPISTSALEFSDSEFGSIYHQCGNCQSTFFNDAIDLFPRFEQEQEFDICLTQEKFVPWFRCLIVSYDFVKFLVQFGMLSWGPYHLIPVKGSEKLKT